MRLCIYEDSRASYLEPVALTRPVFDLWCGACSLLERQCRAFPAAAVGLDVRPEMAALCRLEHPGLPVNDLGWLRQPGTILVNGRWLPPEGHVPNLDRPCAALVGDEIAYVVLPREAGLAGEPEAIEPWLKNHKDSLPPIQAGGHLIGYPWDLIARNPDNLCRDLSWQKERMRSPKPPSHLTVIGPAEGLVVHPTAVIDPFVVADTRSGPVMIDRGAAISSFSRLEGPCYIGVDSRIVGARLRGGTIGQQCRVGGEVEASILHGFSNKYHDGFLGHSYVGAWVNLAAGTQVSDLRNDYGEVSVTVAGARVATGCTKVGAFLGDFTRTGLGALLNTGTVAGAFCNLLPTASLLPRVVPSFCTCAHGQLQERWDLWEILRTAATVMRRRGQELTAVHTDFFFNLFDQTATLRGRILREGEHKRLRRNVSG